MAQVSVITGTRHSGREDRIDRFVAEHWGASILVVPTAAYARRRLEGLLARPGVPGAWGRPVMTFQDLVDRILAEAGVAANPLDDAEQRLLLEQALAPLAGDATVQRAIGAAAEAPGFADQAMRVIHELKQQAVEPARFQEAVDRRAAEGRPGDLDAVIAKAYGAYQDALIASRRYDRDGLYWIAAAHIAEQGLPGAFEDLRLAAFDGFDDFTDSQFRLIRALAGRVDRVAFGLACAAGDPSAADLYEIPLATLRRIREAFPEADAAALPEPEPPHAAARAAHGLFSRTPQGGGGSAARNLHIAPCASTQQEIEWIVREVKALIRDRGADPSAIAVVYRDAKTAMGAVQRVFAGAGVPMRAIENRPLSETAAGRFVLDVVQAIEDWDRDAVCDVLASPWFDADGESAAYAIARIARIIAGREEWLSRLLRLQRDAAEDETRPRPLGRIAGDVAKLDAVLEAVQSLESLDKRLGRQASAQAFIQSLRSWLGEIGFGDDAAGEDAGRAAAAVHRALTRFAVWSGDDPVSRQTFARRLRGVFDRTYLTRATGAGGVAVGSAEALRHLRFRFVFFAGLNEGLVPARPAVNAVFTQEDIAYFRGAGVRLEERQYRASYEMLLFHRALDMADEELWLSYRLAAPDGKELLRSAYINDVCAAAGEDIVFHPYPAATDMAPAYGKAASFRDGRNRVLLDGVLPPDPAIIPGLARAAAGAAAEKSRWRPGACTEFDGILAPGAAADLAAAQFGADRRFSVSALERYAECPFQYFMTSLLGIEEPEIPEEDFDPRVRGAIVHRILERFHRHYAPISLGELAAEAGEARETMAAVAAEEFSGAAWRSVNAPEGLKRAEDLRIRRIVDRYLSLEFARLENAKDDTLASWAPAHFEVSFGLDKHRSDDPWNADADFTLDTPAGPVRFGGKIDRIDLAGDQVRLIDYKSGSPPAAKDIKAGKKFQLNLYALALEAVIAPGLRCTAAEYLPVGRDGVRNAMGGRDFNRDEIAAALPAWIAAYVSALREGRFHPAPDKRCIACPRHRACRFEGPRMRLKFPDAVQDPADEAD